LVLGCLALGFLEVAEAEFGDRERTVVLRLRRTSLPGTRTRAEYTPEGS
jgi:hypothetical protein